MVSVTAMTLVVAHFTAILTFLVMASLSRIFGRAQKKKPLYKLMYLASFLVALAMIAGVLGLEWRPAAYVGAGLDFIGLGIAVWVTVYYWKWLPRELAKG